jgi:hypothetical protein
VPQPSQDVRPDPKEVLLAVAHPLDDFGVEPRGSQEDEVPFLRPGQRDLDRLAAVEEVQASLHRIRKPHLLRKDVPRPMGNHGQPRPASCQPIGNFIHRPVSAHGEDRVRPGVGRFLRQEHGISRPRGLDDFEGGSPRLKQRPEAVDLRDDLAAGDGVVDHAKHMMRL